MYILYKRVILNPRRHEKSTPARRAEVQGWHRHVGNHVTIFSYDMYGLKNKTEDYCDTKMEFLPLTDISAVCPVNYLRHLLQKFK